MKPFVTLLGKTVRHIARLRGGSGSALPGLFIEKISPQFIGQTLGQLPDGVIIISGTNGKTTTTKMVVELLESQGKKVFTNKTGSNFVRGVAAALLGEVDNRGTLAADIAVLELDEAHAVHFVRHIQPRACLLLNVMRDQLDRFAEIDKTADLLEKIAEATTELVVANREDSRIVKIAERAANKKVVFFGLHETLISDFPSDDELHSQDKNPQKSPAYSDFVIKNTVSVLEKHQTILEKQCAEFTLGKEHFFTNLSISGVYNIFNAAAALALVTELLGDHIDDAKLRAALAGITPAFGRGEILEIGGQPLELVLVKNPGGFQLGLKSFDPKNSATMIAINDEYADGRDMSWLWDVDFSSLKNCGVAELSGLRAYDMALRLQYEEVEISHIDVSLEAALRHFIARYSSQPKRIFCTYTAMLRLRKMLAKITKVEEIR